MKTKPITESDVNELIISAVGYVDTELNFLRKDAMKKEGKIRALEAKIDILTELISKVIKS